jgi:polyhydroxyalkanoate synthesis regulator phasin
LGDPFRQTVIQTRREEVAKMIARGIERGDLCPDANAEIATELLVGPVYSRLVFGGELNEEFAREIMDNVMRGYRGNKVAGIATPGK